MNEKQNVKSNGDVVSYQKMKQIFSKLPESSMVRRLVLSEPDSLPKRVAIEKTLLYMELLEMEKEKTFSPLLRK